MTEEVVINKKLSCRKDTVRLLHGSVLAKCNTETIFSALYRSIFNHCDETHSVIELLTI